MRILDLQIGQLFKFHYDKNSVYRREGVERDAEGHITNVFVQRELYAIDGVWYTDRRSGLDNCNHCYNQCTPVVVEVK